MEQRIDIAGIYKKISLNNTLVDSQTIISTEEEYIIEITKIKDDVYKWSSLNLTNKLNIPFIILITAFPFNNNMYFSGSSGTDLIFIDNNGLLIHKWSDKVNAITKNGVGILYKLDQKY